MAKIAVASPCVPGNVLEKLYTMPGGEPLVLSTVIDTEQVSRFPKRAWAKKQLRAGC